MTTKLGFRPTPEICMENIENPRSLNCLTEIISLYERFGEFSTVFWRPNLHFTSFVLSFRV